MNYPDHLFADFHVLKWYGAELNRRYPGTKRNIRFDVTEGLRMYVRVPHNPDWIKIHPKIAREVKAQKLDEDSNRTKRVLETPPSYTPTPAATAAARSHSPQVVLTGRNSVLKAPILSNTTLIGAAERTIIHDPDEVIYISPVKRT